MLEREYPRRQATTSTRRSSSGAASSRAERAMSGWSRSRAGCSCERSRRSESKSCSRTSLEASPTSGEARSRRSAARSSSRSRSFSCVATVHRVHRTSALDFGRIGCTPTRHARRLASAGQHGRQTGDAGILAAIPESPFAYWSARPSYLPAPILGNPPSGRRRSLARICNIVTTIGFLRCSWESSDRSGWTPYRKGWRYAAMGWTRRNGSVAGPRTGEDPIKDCSKYPYLKGNWIGW